MVFRPPNITAPTTEGKIQQIQDYLFILSRDLQIAFEEAETKTEREGSLKESKE
jgi:hypothetical protein